MVKLNHWVGFCFVFILATLGVINVSYSSTKLLILGGAQSSAVSTQSLDYSADGVGFGGGVLAERVGATSGTEIGLFYIHQKVKGNITYNSNKVDLLIDLTRIEIPVVYRYWLLKSLSVGAGVYGARTIGASAAGKNTSNQAAVSLFNPLPKGDAGFVAGTSVHFDLGLSTRLVVDLRYLYGIEAQAKTRRLEVWRV